jgi:HD-GYP domain-containing protein (c-di-GMP phosphodiesterase class II)
MKQLYIAVADCRKVSKQLLQVAAVYPAKLIPVAKLGAVKLYPEALVIVDFQNLSTNVLKPLKTINSNPELSTLGIVEFNNRKQVLQARELGFFNLVDKRGNLTMLLIKLREMFGDYSNPKLSGDFSEKLVNTVKSVCTSFDQMSIAALTGEPLPVSKLAQSAKEITTTIEAEGLDTWLAAVQCHHSHTYCHSMMVTGHAVAFSKNLGMPEAHQIFLGLGGLIHDLGKIKIPLSILDKPGALSEGERNLIDKHPLFSKEILKSHEEIPKEVVELAVSHHEFLDGSGYPDKLSGDQIPQAVRMMTIADIFSALTEKRAYKDSYSPRQAIGVMSGMEGKLDEGLLRTFRDSVLDTDLGHLRRAAFQ